MLAHGGLSRKQTDKCKLSVLPGLQIEAGPGTLFMLETYDLGCERLIEKFWIVVEVIQPRRLGRDMSDARDRKFMAIAVEEMRQSRSEHTHKSDPMVGTVLVDRKGKELARAHRGKFGPGDHAEFAILEQLSRDADPTGGTLYVTLEPCTTRQAPKESFRVE